MPATTRILARTGLLLAIGLSGAPAAAQQPRVQQRAVQVRPAHVDALQQRLQTFAETLPAPERALWEGMLLRAAAAPAARRQVRVSPVLEIGPGGGCEGEPGMDDAANRVARIARGVPATSPGGILVEGGRTRPADVPILAGTGGGRPGVPAADGPRPGNADAVAIGPKQDDPAAPPQSLGRRLTEFASELPGSERAALDWLLTRAAEPLRPGGRPGGDPGDPAPDERVTLRQALGIEPLAIGPKQDDPAPRPPTSRGWTLRY